MQVVAGENASAIHTRGAYIANGGVEHDARPQRCQRGAPLLDSAKTGDVRREAAEKCDGGAVARETKNGLECRHRHMSRRGDHEHAIPRFSGSETSTTSSNARRELPIGHKIEADAVVVQRVRSRANRLAGEPR